MNFDLDAARAARTEATKEENTFTFEGETYSIPPEIPWKAWKALVRNKTDECMAEVLGKDNWAQITEDASTEDVNALLDHMLETWGLKGDGEEKDSKAK